VRYYTARPSTEGPASTSDAPADDAPIPFAETALGPTPSLPPSVPKIPLHLDQYSPRRLKFLERTTNAEKLTAEDDVALAAAMARHRLPTKRSEIRFVAGDSGPSAERQAWFSGGGESGAVEAFEGEQGEIEVGRIIEVRR
jgi:hypothetical protein